MAAGGTLGQGSTSRSFGDKHPGHEHPGHEHPGQQDLPPQHCDAPGVLPPQELSLRLDPQKGAVSGLKAVCGDVSPLVM